MADKSSNRRPVSLNDRHYRLLQDFSAPPKPSHAQEEEKPSIDVMEGGRHRRNTSVEENIDDDNTIQLPGIIDFESRHVEEAAKPAKVKIEGRRRLCKISSRDDSNVVSRVVADEPNFSVITDFDSPSPQPKNVNEHNGQGGNEIMDILNDLSSRLEFMSIEKKKAPKRNEPIERFSSLVEETNRGKKLDMPEYASAESSFLLTPDPSDSKSDASEKDEVVVGDLVYKPKEDESLQRDPEIDNSLDRIKVTKNNAVVEKENGLTKLDGKSGSVGQSFSSNFEDKKNSQLCFKSHSTAPRRIVDYTGGNSRPLKKIEPKEGHERLRSMGRSVLSGLRDQEDDDDCVLLSGKKVTEVKRQVDKIKKFGRSDAVDFLADFEDEAREDDGSITLPDTKNTYKLPGKIAKMLYPHQSEGLKWLWSLHCRGKGGILGDDMGLGKTMQICGFLAGLFHSGLIKRALVVAPKTLLPHWIKELSVVGLSEKTREYFGTCAKAREYELRDILQGKGVLLTTYDIVRNNTKSLCGSIYIRDDDDDEEEDSVTWDYMILDEGHLIKNPSTQRAKSLLQIPSAHRIIISGTPIQNNLKELWALFHFCCPGLLGDKKWFKDRYENFIVRGSEKNASDRDQRIGSTIAKELRERIQPYFLRRLKNEVFCEDSTTTAKLSKKNEVIVWLRLTSCQRQLYEAFLKSELVLSAFDGSPLAALTILKKICDHPLLLTKRAAEDVLEGMDTDSTLNPEEAGMAERLAMHIADVAETDGLLEKHSSVSCKLTFILSLMDNLIPEGHRVLIFSQTRKMLNLIQESLKSNNYNFLRIDGTTKAADRLKIVNDFQEGDAAPIFLLTSQVGGLGLTLTKADRVIVVDPAWNPSTDNQSVDRAYRIGQNKDVVVYRLMSCGTVEEKIYRKQIYKGGLFKTATEQKEQIRYFSQQDLRELFSIPKQGFDVSLTQQQLHEEHDSQHKLDSTLEAHVRFLETLGIAGVSHHSLLFSKTAPVQVAIPEDEEEMRRTKTRAAYMGTAWSGSSSHEPSVVGDEFAFNPKGIKQNQKSPSPDSPGKMTESAIKERINRLSQLLANKITVSRLPDKGAKLQKQIVELKSALDEIRIGESSGKQVIDVDNLTGELQRVLNV